MSRELKEQVCQANLDLVQNGLVLLTWGNVSQIDRQAGIVAIKPSGIAYDDLTPESIVILDLEGQLVEGQLRPSSDTPTHLELYRCFDQIEGVCHTHSTYATMWAQMCCEIPCLGTTHADYFYGAVPVTEPMHKDEIQTNYELNTGKVVVRRFEDIDPVQMPAVLVANHGPFTWGQSAAKAVENATVLEEVARMAYGTVSAHLKPKAISQELLDKHYLRKHGTTAYYGQQ